MVFKTLVNIHASQREPSNKKPGNARLLKTLGS
jgi:hypothetical protein